MKLSAQQVFNKLMLEDKILEEEGQIKFHFANVDIIVKQKDVVGNIIQEWLQGWLNKNGIDYAPNENSQMPPDFYLNVNDKTADLLEVKAFNRNATPGFDIAGFRMYEEELIDKPYMLYVDYLIFGYEMSDEGIVTIKDLWLKKVWEITRRMEDWPINLQVKSGVVHKIRPGVWYSEKNKMPMFKCVEDFLSAIEQTVWQNPKTKEESGLWRVKFLKNYKKYFGSSLSIPKWNEIADSYIQ